MSLHENLLHRYAFRTTRTYGIGTLPSVQDSNETSLDSWDINIMLDRQRTGKEEG